ncbi:MAG TPA: ATP-binding protein [Thermoanaerobaculia bacterium]|nr:ATP-binding protein [Thermoanaerobaculia bacterium]
MKVPFLNIMDGDEGSSRLAGPEAEGRSGMGSAAPASREPTYFADPSHLAAEVTTPLPEASHPGLEGVLTAMADAFVILDRRWRFVFVNDRAAQIAGLTREELLGRVCWEVFPQSVGTVFHQELLRAASQQSVVRFEGFHSRLDGWLENRVYPFADGVAMLTSDITARKRAEEALRFLAEAEALLAGSLDYAETFRNLARLAVPRIADWCAVDLLDDPQTRRITVERADARLEALDAALGFVPAAVIARGETCWLPEVTDDALRGAGAGEEDVARLREAGLRSLVSVPLRPRSRTVGALTFAVARAGRCYGPDDLELAQGLAQVASLSLDNCRLFQRVVEEDRRKDEFLAMMAHELRNPLAPIVNAVEMLRLRGEDPDLRRRATEMIARQARHMARLLDDLLDVSRITYGKIGLRKERVDLVEVARRAFETSRPLFEARQHRVSLALPPEPVWLDADPARLEQVLSNLLNNAAKFTPAEGRIAMEVAAGPDEAVVWVRDDGPGIPPELRSRIFEPFVQEDRSLDRPSSGLGIGLTLVRTLVALHGGTAEVQSEGRGRGSEFTVRLPRLPAEEEPEPGPVAPVPVGTPTLPRILLVEDNPDAAMALTDLLRLWGHEVAVAADGATALEIAGSFRPDVLLLDIGLPGMDGYELAHRLRLQEGLAAARFIALTGYGQETDRRRAAEAGFDHHLTKPADPKVLRELLVG